MRLLILKWSSMPVLALAFALLLFCTDTAMAAGEGDTYFEYSYGLTRDVSDPPNSAYYEGDDWSTESIEAIGLPGDTTIRAMGTSGPGSGFVASVGAMSSWALGPYNDTQINQILVTSSVLSVEQFTYTGGELSFDLALNGKYEWNDQLLSFWDPVTIGAGMDYRHDYGYRISAEAYSDPDDYWASAVEYGGVWGMHVFSQEETISDLSTLVINETVTEILGTFLEGDAGKRFFLELRMETFIDAGDFTVTGDNGLVNKVDFMNTFGATSVAGATIVPEPSTAFLFAIGLVGLAAARRRRSLH